MKSDESENGPRRVPQSAAEAASERAKLFFRAVEYVGSFPRLADCPHEDQVPVIAFTGRSNSGKSSLLSAVCDHHNLARKSSAPGKTRALNYFRVPPHSLAPHGAFLVDLPGYGFAKLSHGERRALRAMVDEFLAGVQNLAVLVLVLDARRNLQDEEENILAYCRSAGQTLLLARTKWDRLNAKEKKQARASWKSAGLTGISIPLSSTKKTNLPEFLKRLRALVSENAP